MAALACAVILIPVIIVSACFAALISNTRTQGIEDARVAPMIELSNIDRTLQLKGSLIARASDNIITEIIVTIANTGGNKPINLEDNPFVINYRDPDQRSDNLSWSWRFQGEHNGDSLLEEGELIQLTISLSGTSKTTLRANTPFVIDLIPSHGAILSIHRTTPTQLEPIFDLQ